MKKITKEELISQNATLTETCKSVMETSAKIKTSLDSIDKERRTEFAKAFGWKKESPFGRVTEDWYLPTWEEIFVHIGKLLEPNNYEILKNKIDELTDRVFQLENPVK